MNSFLKNKIQKIVVKNNKFIMGFLFSIIFIWIVSYFFCNTVEPYVWDSFLDRFAVSPGNVNRERSEGWGTSKMGKHNIYGIPDITVNKSPKIAVWGDSFVNAVQVDDKDKIPQKLTSLFNTNGDKEITAFGIGYMGGAVGDYCLDMQKYEKIASPVIAHYIIISNEDDIFPDRCSTNTCFKSIPDYHFTEQSRIPVLPTKIRTIIRNLELNFLFDLAVSVHSGKKMRFSLGPVQSRKLRANSDPLVSLPLESWSFLCEKITKITDKPVVFVYCPRIPELSNGKFDFTDPRRYIFMAFRNECLKYGIDVIDMSEDFYSYFLRTKKIHRGFANSKPGAGHFNRSGHKLVADSIFRHFQSKLNVQNIIN